MIEIINFIGIFVSLFLFAVFYSLSLTPVKRAEKYGDKAWKQCANFRLISSLFETLTVVGLILWVLFPIPNLFLQIFSQWWEAVLIGMLLLIPFGLILLKGMRDAGRETMYPSKETSMYSGIYRFIRHPQTLGEFPMWAIFGFMTNSLTAFLIGLGFVLIYTPIMIKIEEEDLIRRFGEKYREYKRQTRCLIPKISDWKQIFRKSD